MEKIKPDIEFDQLPAGPKEIVELMIKKILDNADDIVPDALVQAGRSGLRDILIMLVNDGTLKLGKDEASIHWLVYNAADREYLRL